MTAVGMTLGFGDALALAESGSFREFAAGRFRATQVPELLAMGLYEVFADHRAEAVAMRHAVYRGLRTNSYYRDRTTRILACEDRSALEMGLAFFATAARAAAVEIPLSLRRFAPRRGLKIFGALTVRLLWLLRWALQLRQSRRQGGRNDERALDSLARALLHSMPPRPHASGSGRPKDSEAPDAGPALGSTTAHLLCLQGEDGGWE